MAKAKRQLDPALEALVHKRLEGDEMVFDWSEVRPGEVQVWLISEELHRICAPIAKKFGMGAGGGRVLSFKLQDDLWALEGSGSWIS